MVTLLAQSGWPSFLNNTQTLAVLLPIVVFTIVGIIALAKITVRHRERMAMIERGLHPDYPPEPRDPQGPPDV